MAGQSRLLNTVAIGTSQYKWRPFHTVASTFAGTLSTAGTWLGPMPLPATSADFGVSPQIVSPPLDPTNSVLLRAALTNVAGATATLSVFGLREMEGSAGGAGVGGYGGVVEVQGDLLYQAVLTAGATKTNANSSLLVPPAGEFYFWCDDIASVAFDGTRSGVTKLSKIAGGAVGLLFDRVGYPYLLWEWKKGTATRCFGEYCLL